MPRALILLLLAFPCGANAAVDHCRGIVPAEVVDAILKVAPSYRMPKSSDNLEEDVEYNLSQKGTGCLGLARSDFDGDGRNDYLIGLSSTHSDAALVVVAMNQRDGWRIERLDEWADSRSRLFVEAGPLGKYERTEALEGPPSEAGEVLKFTCKHHVAIFGETESSGVAYCKVGTKWLHVWVSD